MHGERPFSRGGPSPGKLVAEPNRGRHGRPTIFCSFHSRRADASDKQVLQAVELANSEGIESVVWGVFHTPDE